MQESLDLFCIACKDFGLTKSTKKTEVMYQPDPSVPFIELIVTVVGEKLAVAEKLIYLGSTLSRTFTINEEVNYRIACASMAFADYEPVCGKEEVYHGVILPSLLYVGETWTV